MDFKAILNSKTALTHIPGCVRCPGFNATAKHNALVQFVYKLCQKAGLPSEKEPRALSTWSCYTCHRTVDFEARILHEKTCTGRRYHRSGPDIVIYWNTGEVFYDLTVIHNLAPSNIHRTSKQLFADAIQRKRGTYVATGLIPEEKFMCIPVLASGSLHSNTRLLLHAIADATLAVRQDTEMEFKLLVQELAGTQVYSQLRQHLSHTNKECESLY